MKNKILKIGLALLVVAIMITSNVFIATNPNLSAKFQKILTIGMSGVAYAETPDYTCDGAEDNVQVKEALDALPATGGKLVLFSGNYDFHATVDRAIGNVCIEGGGYATYVNAGATAVFDDGGQVNWVFKNFRTGTGGITHTGTGSMILGCWIGTTYQDDMVYGSRGATVYVYASNSLNKPSATVAGLYYLCDGTDDHVEINLAITAINAVNGGVVQLSDGNFAGGQILLKANVYLRGQGYKSTTYELAAGKNTSVISSAQAGEIEGTGVSYMRIDANKGSNPTGTYGIDVTGLKWCDIDNVYVYQAKSHGIYGSGDVQTTNGIRIRDSLIYDCTGDGIHLINAWTWQISNNSYIGSNNVGIYIDHGGEGAITGNVIDHSTLDGIALDSAWGVSITNNPYIGDNQYAGIVLYTDSEDTLIEGNWIVENGEGGRAAGIYINAAAERTAIIGNVIQQNQDNNQDYGIYISATAVDVYIHGNNLYGNVVKAIYQVGGATKVQITGNYPDSINDQWFDDFEWGADADAIDTSGGHLIWTKTVAGTSLAEIDTAQYFSGTRSLRLYRDGTNSPIAQFSKTAGTDYSIFFRTRKDADSNVLLYHGNGTKLIFFYYHSDEKIYYYDSSGHDTGVTLAISTWHTIEVKNINWTAGTYDIYANGALAQSGAVMMTSSAYSNLIAFKNNAGTAECAIDDVAVIPTSVHNWVEASVHDTPVDGATTAPISSNWAYDYGAAMGTSLDANDFSLSNSTLRLDRDRNIVLMAGSGWPTTTAGCSYPTLVESTTNKQNRWYADFGNDTDENMEWSIVLPNDFATDGTATITAQFKWTAASGSGNVTWACQWISYGDNEVIDAAYGAAQSVTDTLQTANYEHISSVTAAITGAGTPVAGESVQIRVYRDVSEDGLTADARLEQVILTYHGK